MASHRKKLKLLKKMRIIKEVKQSEVWNHWKTVEGFSEDNFRSDIKDPLPSDMKWYSAILEETELTILNGALTFF